ISPQVCDLIVAPESAERLYARSCSGSPALYRSDDGGQSWSSPAPAFAPALNSLVALPGNVLVGTDGSAAYRSADGGTSWSSVPIGRGITGTTLATEVALGIVYLDLRPARLLSMCGCRSPTAALEWTRQCSSACSSRSSPPSCPARAAGCGRRSAVASWNSKDPALFVAVATYQWGCLR